MTQIAQNTSPQVGTRTFTALLPWLICAGFLLVLPFVFSSSAAITIMSQMSIMIIFALAYNMLLGQAGMLSFGHAIYMGMGGFACVHIMNMVSDHGLPLPMPLLPIFGGLVGMGLATIVGAFSTRSTGTVFAMISLGVGELIAACSIIFVSFFGGEAGVSGYRDEGLPVFGVDFAQEIEVYYLIAVWLMLSTFLMFWFSRTALGRMANAVRDNPERVEFLGYSARLVRYYSFVASGFFAGVAGGLSAINYEIMTEENLNLLQSGTVLLVTFLGGAGFFIGPIVGAVVFTLLSTVLSLQTELWQLYVGALFVATVMFFPGGLVGLVMMHAPAVRANKLGLLYKPYALTLLPGAIAVLGLASLTEMVFHLREATPGQHEMTLFWTTFDSHSVMPWVFVIIVTGTALWQVHRSRPELMDAWGEANSTEGAGE